MMILPFFPQLLLLLTITTVSIATTASSNGLSIVFGENDGDRLGSSVALSANGQVMVVGSPVRVFRRANTTTTTWSTLPPQRLASPDDAAATSSVVAVSDDGRVIAVGEPKYDHGRGRVLVYEWDGRSEYYVLQTDDDNDLQGTAHQELWGCTVALSADGSRLAVGARLRNHHEAGVNAGQVWVYERRAPRYADGRTSWRIQHAVAHGEAAYDGFGFALALSSDGTTLAVGAPANRDYQGYVRIYQWQDDDEQWALRGDVLRGNMPREFFGWSVDLSSDGRVCAVGVPQSDNSNGVFKAGETRVFRWNGEAWLPMMGQDNDNSVLQGSHEHEQAGQVVQLSGNGLQLAVSAMDYQDSKSNQGYVRMFQWTKNGSWVAMPQDIVGHSARDRLGLALALSSDGTVLASGARRTEGANLGHVRVTPTRELLLVEPQDVPLPSVTTSTYR